MPYEWLPPSTTGGAQAELHLWPYRSLPKKGFVTFFGVTFGMVSLPLLAVVGSPILWGLLPFVAVVLGGAWWALQRNYRDGSILEELRFWDDKLTLTRHNPRAPRQDWEANPHWVRVHDYGQEGRIEHYLTLKGGPREVEIGAFLSVDERRALLEEITAKLNEIRRPVPQDR
ncbi:DUF2244 domain-containing protein [Flavimaricola marinus]|uniref:Integral membrane protein (DUF2244) n=1 Tax=Flavimaricola marinus TaxID=1819565 RepID=A0A238LJZ5_9RHOB|nr:DUF2244 domain-containing protein [Flavimaricola marinus]SMY09200.1 hypothetical protein LOM8899_03364 [Flavimaricola marinus]